MLKTETSAGTDALNDHNSTLYKESVSVAAFPVNDDTGPRATLPDPEPEADEQLKKPIKDERENQRDLLVQMVIDTGCELFHDKSGNTFARVPINGHNEYWRLRSEGFRRWLRHAWHIQTTHGIGISTLTDALDTQAFYSGKEYEVHIRVAHHNGDIYVDLCNDQWQAIKISPNGWSVVDDVPVKFGRTAGMLPLPKPIKGGKIDGLRHLINAPTDDIWYMVVAWILATFSEGPFPVLVLLGEQGSAKSFLCRVLRQLIDPSEVEVTMAPKDARDVMFAAQNSYIVALDNLSGISDWLSDLLCRIATGAAHRERQYHTNDGTEVLFKAKRPSVLNGIDFAMRDDLLSRSLLVTLPVIADDKRQDEKELWTKIQVETPNILGGIFDLLATILENLPTTKLDEKPRMADFALWITAAEPALSLPHGQFMQLYTGNRTQAVDLALESDAFGAALVDFINDKDDSNWTGGWKDLLSSLNPAQLPQGWPKTAKSVACRLKRLAPALRHYGINWNHERNGAKRFYHIWKKSANPSNVSNQSFNPFQDNLADDMSDTTDDISTR